MKRFVLIDGNALLHRAYHAIPFLTTSAGELVNAVYGFSSMLLRTFEQLNPDYVAVCWDRKAPTFRHIDYVGYKANRKKMDEGLAGQFERAAQVTSALNIPSFGVDGYEADDLIGTLARQAAEQNVETIIVTGDRDALQLLNTHTNVFMPKGSLVDATLYTTAMFEKKYGFPPQLLADFKGLAGDSSDNIPGVRGVGEVTAAKLIGSFGGIENLYRSLDKVPEKIAQKLVADAEAAVLSKKLATIVFDVPIVLDLAACALHDYDQEKARQLLQQLEFKSLINRLPRTDYPKPANAKQTSLFTQYGGLAMNTKDEALIPVLKAMYKKGVLVDTKALAALSDELSKRLTTLEESIYTDCGHVFNLNSPKQLAEVLFDELHLPVIKKTKTSRSTDESVLYELMGAHPCIASLITYRELFKLKSTYLEAWPRFIGKDGRIHSTFKAGGAVTGRLSSSEPNLQNIPIKGEWGTKIRSAIVAPSRFMLVSADYSQIELRMMAHIADDPGLKKAFQEGIDIHTMTAARVFDIPLETVTEEQRRMAKTIVFGLMYGMGAHSLAKTLSRSQEGAKTVEYEKAAEFIQRYFAQFPKVRAYMEKTIREATEKGYGETLSGRRRTLPELSASDSRIKAAGERMAINFPIQGTAADVINTAMIAITKRLKQESSKSALILQIHDELLFEVPNREVWHIARAIKQEMEQAMTLSVPIVAEVKKGNNWGQMTRMTV